MPINPKSPQYWRNTKHRPIQRTTEWRKKSNSQKHLFTTIKSWIFSKNTMVLGAYTLLVIFVIGFISFLWLSRGLPEPNKLLDREVAESTKIYDRSGETILYDIHGEEKRTLVPLDQIPKSVRDATIAIEDKDFYHHKGFSFWAIFRTAVTNVFTNRKAGGSTLTQQFVKNAILTTEKSYTRKLKEVILAYRLEKNFSKDEILQMYFNEIPYGSNAYGVEAASLKYFGKNAKDISLAESAILAAMVQSPTRYSPYGPNKDILLSRQQYVLDLMVDQNMVSKEEAQAAKDTKLSFKAPTENIIAPHFVMRVKELLAEKYGEKAIEQDGLKIYTTLDSYKQNIAEEVLKKKAFDNEKKFQASNAAMVSIDPKTGQILAMVGSRDYFDDAIDGQVNVVLQPRQPGSSIKPIIYAAAFEKGYTPNTIIYDVVTNFAASGPVYEPRNYNGQEYGPVSMKKALAGSLNVPAVKTLYLAGIDRVVALSKKLGYTTLADKDRFGLSLVLGGGEVKLLEHTNAYSAFAREGLIHEPSYILKVEDRNGKILEEYKNEETRVFDSNIARLINFVLSDNNERSFIFGASNFLTLGNRPVAAKSGTTNNNRDAWTIGYTPSLVTGVWVGNNNNTEMKAGADGSVVAAPIWNEYMRRVLGNENIESFNAPKIDITGKAVLDGVDVGLTKVKIDKASGLLATEFTPPNFIEEKSFQEPHTILYYINKNDPRGPELKNPSDDPQFDLWESRIQAWAIKNKINIEKPPTEKDNLHLPENRPNFSIKNFSDGQEITNGMLSISILASAPRGIGRVEYSIDNATPEIITTYPFGLEKNLYGFSTGFHDITIKVCDDIDNCSEQKLTFNLKS
ncbi:penicillin-binding protein [Candidatus Falkowbacteria bacterium]|nr:MAG: penicillin-binding protein [Candidatus Falkowbacteria bacterium]